ncbi:hypothetical protein [Pseudohongiella spirulinae]|uniref:Uncharacterized protein n=1 Tax=Pseudohongiella spirulinae TaxID=1249552 RepID=A0A0S2KF50_9GAMM|nr:hypothetical protein [Pseudohongiella spirulinae]ALO46983.1 hypothetical protein PS2015_2349 [Pseudohongiella spirulinae]
MPTARTNSATNWLPGWLFIYNADMPIYRIRLFLLLALSLPLILAVMLAALTLRPTPLVPGDGTLQAADIRQLEQLIADNSPSRLSSSGQRELSLTGDELSLLGNFALNNLDLLQDSAVAFTIDGDQAYGQLSMPIFGNVIPLYANLSAHFAQREGEARLVSVRAGYLPIPAPVIRIAEQLAGKRLGNADAATQEMATLRHQVRTITLANDQLHLQLHWEPETLTRIRDQARQVLVPPEDRDRVLAYHLRTLELSAQLSAHGRSASLVQLLPQLFKLAIQRSDSDADTIAENRALLLSLSLFVNRLPIDELIAVSADTPLQDTSGLQTTLFRRSDLSQHFITSAALAVSAGAEIAQVLSNIKEVYDSQRRSGFSFSDMTANLAGVAFAEAATSNPESARRLQRRMASAGAETDFMPSPATDADALSESAFADIFEDRNSDVYNDRLAQISDQIAVLPIYLD